MPLVDGFEVLAWLKAQEFPNLRVAVLSGSNRNDDIQKALELGAHFYYVKDADTRQLQESLRELARDFSGAGNRCTELVLESV